MRIVAEQQPGWERLGRRISGWTSNLLATAIVVVLALGLGRQLVVWWGVDETSSPENHQRLSSTSPLAEVVDIEFGDRGYALEREPFVGDASAALAQLRAACRERVQTAQAPSQLPGASEQRFLEQAAGREPVERSGQWELHQFGDAFPLVVGIRRSAEMPSAAGGEKRPLAHAGRRVLAWGLAVPAGERQWTLYVYRATRSSSPETAILSRLPLPQGSRRTLSLIAGGGQSTIGLVGQALPEAWADDFDRGFGSWGWHAKGWRRAGGAWQASWHDPESPERRVEVIFGPDNRGGLSGLIVVSDPPSRTDKKSP